MKGDAPADTAVRFARALRAAGLDVPVGSVTAYVDALGALGVDRRQSAYWAGRATLVRRPEDIPLYDEVFVSFWLGLDPEGAPVDEERTLAFDVDVPDDHEEDGDALVAPEETVAVRYSARETLRHKDFAAYSRAEFAEARKLMADLRLVAAARRSRRLRRSARDGRRPDVRGTVRAALRTGAEPVRRRSLEPARRPRRVVLLCDVSGSMEPYTRALLRFLHVAVAGRGRVEAFVFATRLTRITRHLSWRDPDAALAKAGVAVADWSGGTRLGTVLGEFNSSWGDLARRAIVVVLSDGWDRGDPDVLTAELERLRRHAHRVVWVNPLKGSPGYAPLARGMAAALPFVDDFVEGHSLAAMEQLVEVIGRS
ncbi:MAG TPA: VWA domain-containing protein [Acidimicrobiales bacterium]|nr:VWA domain-containing protein [Acidimicrobiales bacterium]